MDTGFLHTHTLIVTLYLLQLIVKVVLVAMKKDEFLEKNSKKLKMLDMILGPLLLITGGYLFIKMLMNDADIGAFFYLKLVLVFASIPVGIIGMRKKNLPLLILAVLLLAYVFAMSKTKDIMLRSSKAKQESVEADLKDAGTDPDLVKGQAIYVTRCQLCHGEDGAMGFQGAKNLQETELKDDGIAGIIRNGKGVMPGISDRELSEKDVTKVVKYVRTLGDKKPE